MTTANIASDDTLLTFKEAQDYLRTSRSTLYRLMERHGLQRETITVLPE